MDDIRRDIAERIEAIAQWRRDREQQDMMGLGSDAAMRSRRSARGLDEADDKFIRLYFKGNDLHRQISMSLRKPNTIALMAVHSAGGIRHPFWNILFGNNPKPRILRALIISRRDKDEFLTILRQV